MGVPYINVPYKQPSLYLSLLGTLHRLDRAHTGRLEPEEFRAAIESTLHIEFKGVCGEK